MVRRSSVTRRDVLSAGAAMAGIGSLAGCSRIPGFAGGETAHAVGTEQVASGFTSPLGMEVAPGDEEHLFVVDQAGQVHVVGPDGRRETPLLDVTDRMVDLGGYEERGLLGMAFHPEFQNTRRVFVRYSAPLRDGMPAGFSHTFVLSSFRVDEEFRVEDGSERVLLEIVQPQANHNAGAVVFGPDGYLYVGVGDGGAANDDAPGHVDDWYDRNAGGNGQDVTENLLGSLLRIDVDDRDGERPYGIPADNPLVDREGLAEQYAWGFRNPWRLSFAGGELFVADVGQDRFEEVNVVEKGGNYGWNVREGTHCFSTDSPGSPPENCPDRTPDGEELRDPIIEYPHGGDGPSGISVIGGYLYRAGTVGRLRDRYVFGDWRANGQLFVARRPADEGLWPIERVSLAPIDGQSPGQFLLSFGRDHDGELYVLTNGQARVGGESGRLHRLVPANDDPGTTTATTDANGTGTLTGTLTGTIDGTRERTAGEQSEEVTAATGDAGFSVLSALAGIAGLAVQRLRK